MRQMDVTFFTNHKAQFQHLITDSYFTCAQGFDFMRFLIGSGANPLANAGDTGSIPGL